MTVPENTLQKFPKVKVINVYSKNCSCYFQNIIKSYVMINEPSEVYEIISWTLNKAELKESEYDKVM